MNWQFYFGFCFGVVIGAGGTLWYLLFGLRRQVVVSEALQRLIDNVDDPCAKIIIDEVGKKSSFVHVKKMSDGSYLIETDSASFRVKMEYPDEG